MHFVEHPNAMKGETIYRNSLPLRVEPVERKPGDPQYAEAIGLYFEQEIFAQSVLWYGGMYFLASLIFGILWWRKTGEFGDAFTGASFLLGFLAICSLALTVIMSR